MNADRAIDHAALLTTYGGAVTSLTLWGLRLSDLSVMVSAFVAILGFAVHLWITVKRDRREQEIHLTQLEILRNGNPSVDKGAVRTDR